MRRWGSWCRKRESLQRRVGAARGVRARSAPISPKAAEHETADIAQDLHPADDRVDDPTASTLEGRARRWLGAVGRVKGGGSVAEMQRDLDRVASELATQYPATLWPGRAAVGRRVNLASTERPLDVEVVGVARRR